MAGTKDQILDVAEHLLQSKGFTAFSYADISKSTGTTKANIHHHFASKEELGCALIDRYRSRYKRVIEDAELKDLSSREKLNIYFDSYKELLDLTDRICYGGTLGASYNALPSSMQSKTDQMVEEHIAWLSNSLAAAKEDGEVYFEGHAHETALMIVAMIQGCLQIVRSAGRESFEVLINKIKQMIRF